MVIFLVNLSQMYNMVINACTISDSNFSNNENTYLQCFQYVEGGIDLLKRKHIDSMFGHGGIFKTEKVAQSFLASSPVRVMQTASEGGAWGIAVLARYMIETKIKFSNIFE